MRMMLYDFLQEPNLVIWGCGIIATSLVDVLPDSNKIVECIDTDISKQGKVFLNKWIIKDSSVLNKDKHKVIVTPHDSESVICYLDKNGYSRDCDYTVISDSDMQFLQVNHIINITRQYSDNILFVLQPYVYQIINPSQIEIALKHYECIIKNRSEWLKGNPPHISTAHRDLPYYSDSYIENIFTGANPINQNGVLMQSEHKSEYVNVVGGFRVTTDQPNHFNHHIHMVGSSHVYGFGVEDKYTISSCLQRIINEQFPNTYSVVNHGVRGLLMGNYYGIIRSANIQKDDIVIITIPSTRDNRKSLSNNGIRFIDLVDIIQRPHSYGEIFFDSNHMNFKGNLCYSNSIMYPLSILIKNNMRYSTNALKSRTNDEIDSNLCNNSDFKRYIELLNANKFDLCKSSNVIGSIVMNCNPFTLGHYHLVKVAAQIVDYLYIFIVEEDRSIFAYQDRFELVQKGVSNLQNVKVIPSGTYIISNITFPEYFDKDNLQETQVDASLDLQIFGKHIAPALDITVRFIGEEPSDMITRQYNEHMKRLLPLYGIKCIEIPRAKTSATTISASIVRKKLANGNLNDIKAMVPSTTYEYLEKNMSVLCSKIRDDSTLSDK